MNAVAVESQCGITKQHHRIRRDLVFPDRLARRGLRRRGRGIFIGFAAVDDVLFLGDGDAVGVADVGFNRHEHHAAAAAVLDGDILDRRFAMHFIADMQRCDEGRAFTGKHAPRQRHRRQKVAARRVAVGADLRMAHHARKQDRVPAHRQRLTHFRKCIIAVQRCRQAVDGRDRHVINRGFGAAYPFFQGFQFCRHASLTSLLQENLQFYGTACPRC